MAAATAIIAGASLAIGAATAAKGAIDAGNTNKDINNYRRQKLDNKFDYMPISTRGSDLLREESARSTNSLTNMVARGGSRAITANTGRIASNNIQMNQYAAMQIDGQYNDRAKMIAAENSRIQGMYETREQQDLAGLGAKLQADRETTWNGISLMQAGIYYGAENGAFDKKPRETQYGVSSLGTSSGYSYNNIKGGYGKLPGVGRQHLKY